MIKKLADRWAAYMIANGADAGQEEVYVYGFQCLANELVSDVILIALMLPLGKAKEMLIWILVFDVLRQKVGRYHAATPLKCQLQSISVGILSVLAQPVWERNGGLGTVSMLLACVIVFKIAPVTNPRHPVSDLQKKQAQKSARIFTAVSALLSVLLFAIVPALSAMIQVSVCSVVLLGLIGKRQNSIHED